MKVIIDCFVFIYLSWQNAFRSSLVLADNGKGDACEPDGDGDGIRDDLDNCPNNTQIYKTDFSSFQTVMLDPIGESQLDPNWVIYNEGAEITQTVNNDPGLAVGYDRIGGVDYEGTFFIDTNNDNDFVGFVFR